MSGGDKERLGYSFLIAAGPAAANRACALVSSYDHATPICIYPWRNPNGEPVLHVQFECRDARTATLITLEWSESEDNTRRGVRSSDTPR